MLLGSAPLRMAQGLTESLAGRFETLRLAHWSYAEMREAFGLTLDQYPYFGGYPGAAHSRGSSPKLQVMNTALMTVTCGVSLAESSTDREFRGRLIESAVGAHLANAAAAAECELYYWRDRGQEIDFVAVARGGRTAIEVKGGRAPQARPGSAAFAATFKVKRTLLVGGDGIAIKEFLGRPVSEWLSSRS